MLKFCLIILLAFLDFQLPVMADTILNPGYSDARIQPANIDYPSNIPDPGNQIAAFREVCQPSHTNNDDPILFPNQPGASHTHLYWGNTGTNNASTVDSLRNSGNSTCGGGILNRSAYWAPEMLNGQNNPVYPWQILVYYKSMSVDPSLVQAPPAGLKMVAGNFKATPTEGATTNAAWACTTWTGWFQTIPTNCVVGDSIMQQISFDPCWDGKNLDSPDHKSHMSPTVYNPKAIYNQACPADHPIQLPDITFILWYKVTADNKTDIPNWHLVSDKYPLAPGNGGASNHADWMGAWDPDILITFTKNCLNKNLDCHAFLLGDGRTLY